jgi:hypothetical protein
MDLAMIPGQIRKQQREVADVLAYIDSASPPGRIDKCKCLSMDPQLKILNATRYSRGFSAGKRRIMRLRGRTIGDEPSQKDFAV